MSKKKVFLTIMTGMLVVCLTGLISVMGLAKTTISIWTAYPEMHEFQKRAGERYEKLNPEIDIEATLFPQRALEEKVAAALPAGEACDVLDLGTMSTYPYYVAGLFEEVPADLVAWLKENFPPAAIKYSTVPGTNKLYTMPNYISLKAMFYNKDHFKEAGFTTAPETIAEQMMYAEKLVRYDAAGNPTRVGLDLRLSGGGFGTAQKYWTQVIIPYGTKIIEPVGDKWRAAYDNEWGQKALKYYLDAVYKYKVESFEVKSDAEGFGLGVTSMFQRESWVIGYLRDNAPEINYGVFLMPKGPRGWGTIANMLGICVPKSSPHKKEAWAFAKWLVNDDNMVRMFGESGWQPYRANVDYSSLYKEAPAIKGFVDALATPGYEVIDYELISPIFEIHSRMAEQLMIAFKKPELLDPKKLAAAIHDMAKETNRILDDYDLLAK